MSSKKKQDLKEQNDFYISLKQAKRNYANNKRGDYHGRQLEREKRLQYLREKKEKEEKVTITKKRLTRRFPITH